MVRALVSAKRASRRLPLNESIDLTIDQRIDLGDQEAIHDFARDAIADLEAIADRVAGLLCGEPEALVRLAEVRIRQERTGKSWHGPAVSGSFEETVAMDRPGKEPRGPRRGQENSRGATGGKPAKKRGKSC